MTTPDDDRLDAIEARLRALEILTLSAIMASDAVTPGVIVGTDRIARSQDAAARAADAHGTLRHLHALLDQLRAEPRQH